MKSFRKLTFLFCITITILEVSLTSMAEGALPESIAETLELRINSELERIVQELITEKQICEELWITWPIDPPTQKIEEVEKEIKKLINNKSQAEFPESLEEEYEKEAVAKYDLFKIGQFVEFTLHDGTEVSGYLRERKQSKILIDNRPVELSEIDADELTHFDEAIREIRIKEYIRAKLVQLKERRVEYEQKIMEEVSQKLFMESGYIQVRGKWISKKEFVSDRLSNQREKLQKRLKPLQRAKIYYENGFVEVDNEWITKKEAERRRQEQAEKERAALEALENSNDEGKAPQEDGEEDDPQSLWE